MVSGEKLVRLARSTVENYIKTRKFEIVDIYKEKRGVFVTIETYPGKKLRGCIGFPSAVYPLSEAVQRAALSAAFEDPRFPPVDEDELDKIIFEISILTEPELINVKDKKEYLNCICKKDGLIIINKNNSGLFLPQVWEQIKDKKKFLECLCMKAFLPTDAWMDEDTKLFKFHVQVFKELKPNGKVESTE